MYTRRTSPSGLRFLAPQLSRGPVQPPPHAALVARVAQRPTIGAVLLLAQEDVVVADVHAGDVLPFRLLLQHLDALPLARAVGVEDVYALLVRVENVPAVDDQVRD